MALNPCLLLIALLAVELCSCVAGVQNDTNASALIGNGKEGHTKSKVIFAYAAFAVGGTLMFVGFIYLIVWALTAKDGQESPEPKQKHHGLFMDPDIAGRKTAPENVGGGEEMKYDPDTYLPIITVSDAQGTDKAYANGHETGYHIEQESKSDGDMTRNNNLLQVANPPRRHSAEDPMVKTKRHSIEYGKKRHSKQSQQSHTQNEGLENNDVVLVGADRRRSIDSGGRHSPSRKERRHSDISAVSSTSRQSSLHDELSRRRASNISISEVEQGTGANEESMENRQRNSGDSQSNFRPDDSPKSRRASLDVENLHQVESNTDSVRRKKEDVHFVATDNSRVNKSPRNSQEEKRHSVHSKRNSQQYGNGMYESKRNSVQHEEAASHASQSKRNSQQYENGMYESKRGSVQHEDAASHASQSKRNSQQYENGMYESKRGSVQHEDAVSHVSQSKRNSQQYENGMYESKRNSVQHEDAASHASQSKRNSQQYENGMYESKRNSVQHEDAVSHASQSKRNSQQYENGMYESKRNSVQHEDAVSHASQSKRNSQQYENGMYESKRGSVQHEDAASHASQSKRNSQQYENGMYESKRGSVQHEDAASHASQSRRNSQQYENGMYESKRGSVQHEDATSHASQSKRNSQQYENGMYQSKGHSVQQDELTSHTQHSSQQSDTASEDSSSVPRKKSWLYDKFAFRKKKKNKGEKKLGKYDDGQSTDDGYSTIEGKTEDKDKLSLTKYSKTDTDYRSAGLLAVPLIANARNSDAFQRSSATAAEYINKKDSQVEATTAYDEEKAPGKFQFRSAGPTKVYAAGDSDPVNKTMTEMRPKSQDTTTSRLTSKTSEGMNDQQIVAYDDAYNDAAEPEHFETKQIVQVDENALTEIQNHEEATDYDKRQSVAESSFSHVSDNKRDSLANISTKTTSSDGEPVSMIYNVQDGKVDNASKRSSERNSYHESSSISAMPVVVNRHSVHSYTDQDQTSNVVHDSNRNSTVHDDREQQPEDVSALPEHKRHSVNSNDGDHQNEREVSESHSSGIRPSSISSDKESGLSQNALAMNSDINREESSHQDNVSLQAAQTHVEKAESQSNSHESEGDFSYETAPSDTDSQKYAAANTNRDSYNSGDSYASGSALETNHVSQQSTSGSMNNRLSADSIALVSNDKISSEDNVEKVLSTDATSVKDGTADDDDTTQESERNSVVSAGGVTDNQYGNETNGVSPPVRPDSPVPLERVTSAEDNVIEDNIEAAETVIKAKSSPPPAPPPPKFFIPPPPPLPSVSFARKPSSNDLPSLKPVKRGDSPNSGGSSSPMPFMVELTKRLNKYSDPKVDHGTAAVNVTRVLKEKASSESNNIETVVKEIEPLLYEDGNGPQNNDESNNIETVVKETEPQLYEDGNGPQNNDESNNIETVVNETEPLLYEDGNGPQNNDESNNIETVVKETEPQLYEDGNGPQNNDIRDGNNSSLSNESEMSIPQAIESGEDTAPQSPDVSEDGSNGGNENIDDKSIPESGSDAADPVDKHVEFRDTISHIPSPASSTSMSESQLAMFEGKRPDLYIAAKNLFPAKRPEYPKEKYPNLLLKTTLNDDLEVSSNHPDDTSSASEETASNSTIIHQEASGQSAEQTTITSSGGNNNQPTTVPKPEASEVLPQQEEFEYPSDLVSMEVYRETPHMVRL